MFADKKYEISAIGGQTVFSSMGSSLGDRINFSSILKCYGKDNPGENIYVCEPYDFPKKVMERMMPDRFFWADVTNFWEKPNNVIEYDLMREVHEIASSRNIFPEVEIEPVECDVPSKRYIVMSIRNVKKAVEKNPKPIFVYNLIQKILWLNIDIVLVGNDDPLPYYYDMRHLDQVIDMRKKISLAEIMFVMSNAELFIGSDSGLVHLAGCVKDLPIVTWNQTDSKWFPVTKNECYGFLRIRSSIENIIGAIRKIIERKEQ